MKGKKVVYKALLLVIVIGTVGCFVFSFAEFQRKLSENIWKANYSFLEEVVNQEIIAIQAKISGQWEQLTLYARSLENTNLADAEAVKDMLDMTSGYGPFNRISVADNTGYVIHNDDTASQDISSKDYYIKTMQGDYCASEELDTGADEKTIYVLSVPVYQRQEIAGVLMGTLDTERVQEIVTEEVFGGSGIFCIVDGQGRILVTGKDADIFAHATNYVRYLQRTSLTTKEVEQVKEDLAGGVKEIREYTVGKEGYVVCYQPMGVNDWMLVSVVDRDFIINQRKDINRLVAGLIVSIVLTIGLLIGCLLFVLRQSGREKLDNEKLKVEAEHDSLTKLYNKGALEEHVRQRILEPVTSPEGAFALYIMDLDNFKSINDSLGHAFGDRVLCDAAFCMSRVFGAQDILGRIGGDEFIVLMDMREVPPEKRDEVVEKKAALLCKDFTRTYTSQNTSYMVSVSVGVALFGYHGTTFEELYTSADRALYATKSKGKNNYTICQK